LAVTFLQQPNLLLAEDIADHRIQTNIVDDGIGDDVEVVNQLLELLPRRAPLREDQLELLVISPRHGRHHGDGPGGAFMGPVASDLRDAAGDVPQAGGNSASPGVNRVYCDSGRIEEGLDLRLQV
jgi:hypothetical protein